MDAGSKPSKSELRRSARQRIAELPDAARAAADLEIADRLLTLPELTGVENIFCCLSFGVEVDTWHLVERLLATDRRIFVPRADFATHELHVHAYPCDLEQLRFGLRQPTPTAPELDPSTLDQTLDVAIIPGLAFDRAGFRLGHGGGFFDRFLPGRPFATVGVCYAIQVSDDLPIEPHDRALDVVVTEREILRGSDQPAGASSRSPQPR